MKAPLCSNSQTFFSTLFSRSLSSSLYPSNLIRSLSSPVLFLPCLFHLLSNPDQFFMVHIPGPVDAVSFFPRSREPQSYPKVHTSQNTVKTWLRWKGCKSHTAVWVKKIWTLGLLTLFDFKLRVETKRYIWSLMNQAKHRSQKVKGVMLVLYTAKNLAHIQTQSEKQEKSLRQINATTEKSNHECGSILFLPPS